MNDVTVKSKLFQEAYDIIKEKIIYLELLPGQVISDYILSKELNMSRTPIREALLELRRDGLLVDVTKGKGYEVSKITPDEVKDLFDAREALETMAVKIAMKKKIPQDKINELKILNEKILQAHKVGKLQDVFYNDQQLHIKLVSLSGNKRIIGFNNTILLQLTRMRFLTYFQTTLPGLAVEEHNSLIQNIINGEVNQAIEVLTSHICDTKDAYIFILNNYINSEEFGALKYLMKKDIYLNDKNSR